MILVSGGECWLVKYWPLCSKVISSSRTLCLPFLTSAPSLSRRDFYTRLVTFWSDLIYCTNFLTIPSLPQSLPLGLTRASDLTSCSTRAQRLGLHEPVLELGPCHVHDGRRACAWGVRCLIFQLPRVLVRPRVGASASGRHSAAFLSLGAGERVVGWCPGLVTWNRMTHKT